MNPERILDLADIIENSRLEGHEFRINGILTRHTGNSCKTAGCIAGTVIVAAYGPNEAMNRYLTDASTCVTDAARILDLTIDEQHDLFYPIGWNVNKIYTKELVARVLRNFAETNIIDWSIA